MLHFSEARARILAAARVLGAERVPLAEADGRVLAEDLVADTPLPPFDYSAMDGYAVLSADFAGEPPWELPVRGESRAGGLAPRFAPGSAVRIFTGAPLPEGADGVVIQENVERRGELALFARRPRPGDNVRRAGEDLAPAALALARGTRLGPFQLGLAAALDRSHVAVARRPRVALHCTGDELRPPGSTPRAGSVPESNGVALGALAARAGADVRLGRALPDDLPSTTRALAEALVGVDVLVTVGGVSVGDRDLVRAALEAAGVGIQFWKVAIKPGKPFVFGRHGDALVLGLPGNPVSAQVTFALFGMPLLRALQGDRAALPAMRSVRLAGALRQQPGRLGVYRARLEGELAHVHENQASGATTSLAHADALVFVPAEVTECGEGTRLEALSLGEL